MQAVLVGVFLAPEGGALGTFVDGPKPIMPVVAIGEAAAGPAQDGGLDLAHGVEKGLADAALVGDSGFFAHPDAVVDDPAEMLDEVAVDLGGDGGDRLGGEDVDVGVDLGGLRQGDARSEGQG
jgi:hypothetical protein